MSKTRIQKLKDDIQEKERIISNLRQENMVMKGQVTTWRDAFEKLLGRIG